MTESGIDTIPLPGVEGLGGRLEAVMSSGKPVWGMVLQAALPAAAALVILHFCSQYVNSLMIAGVITAIAVVGLHVLIHWTGQISLGQVAFVGVGAFTTMRLNGSYDVPILVCLLASALAGALFSLVIGLPARRIHGLALAAATLVFGLVANDWLFQQNWVSGGAYSTIELKAQRFAGFDLVSQRSLLIPFVVVLIAVVAVTARIDASPVGRSMRLAAADDEVAASYGVNVPVQKLLGFLYAGALAGLAGSLYAISVGRATPTDFPTSSSLLYVSAALQAGAGPALASMWTGAGLGIFTTMGANLFGGVVTVALGPLAIILTLTFYPGGVNEVSRKQERAVAKLIRRARMRWRPRRGVRSEGTD